MNSSTDRNVLLIAAIIIVILICCCLIAALFLLFGGFGFAFGSTSTFVTPIP
ncbi:MAG: hypothetical protein KA314_16925 [Chloroflexi bacterium]|nr:hypothetical protein [Chloroflexota bacterium]MBP8057516.1 hypothetical protein [Chloroflexota bacterium]